MFEVILSPRDFALLRLLDLTPATVPQIRKASVTFAGEPFHDDRRVRERLQALSDAGLVRSWQAAIPGGGLMLYFRLTLEGHRAAFGEAEDSPTRTRLNEIAPSRVKHAMITADAIVHTLVASHERGVRVQQSHGDGQLTLEIGEYRQQPDCHFQLAFGGRLFNLLFEIDNATEPLDSRREHSIRTKILGYETYQMPVLRALAEYYVLSSTMIHRICFPTHRDARSIRRRLARLVAEGYIRRSVTNVALSIRNAGPVYSPTTLGCEALAIYSGDDAWLATNTRPPRIDRLYHWLDISHVHATLREAVESHPNVTLVRWINEWQPVMSGDGEPTSFVLHTQFRVVAHWQQRFIERT